MVLLYFFRMRKSRLAKLGVCKPEELYGIWDQGVDWHLDISTPKIMEFDNEGQAREKWRQVIETSENRITPEGLYRINRRFEEWFDNKFKDAGKYLIRGQIEHADYIRKQLGQEPDNDKGDF